MYRVSGAAFNIPHKTAVEHFPVADAAVRASCQNLNGGWIKLGACELRVRVQDVLSRLSPEKKHSRLANLMENIVEEGQPNIPDDASSISSSRHDFLVVTVELQ